MLNRGYPNVQKVVLTGHASEKYRAACLSNGAESLSGETHQPVRLAESLRGAQRTDETATRGRISRRVAPGGIAGRAFRWNVWRGAPRCWRFPMRHGRENLHRDRADRSRAGRTDRRGGCLQPVAVAQRRAVRAEAVQRTAIAVDFGPVGISVDGSGPEERRSQGRRWLPSRLRSRVPVLLRKWRNLNPRRPVRRRWWCAAGL
jgi:hypothetical protein